jgi:hypothetical protein
VAERTASEVHADETRHRRRALAKLLGRPSNDAVDFLVLVVIVDNGNDVRALLDDRWAVDAAEVRKRTEQHERALAKAARGLRVRIVPVFRVVERGAHCRIVRLPG